MVLGQAYSNCIEINNVPLSYSVNELELHKLLRMFGNFTQQKNKQTNNTLVCFVDYENEEQVKKALTGFQDLLVKDHKLNANRLTNS